MTIQSWRRLTFAASLSLLPGMTGASSAEAQVTYSGRAFAAYLNLPTVGMTNRYLADTGQLPPSGGFLKEALLALEVPGVLSAEVLVARTSGANGVAASSASLAEVTLLPGNPAQVTAAFVQASSEATCSGTRGSTEVAGLTFGGAAVGVTEAPNQTVEIPGVATLIINEQIPVTEAGRQEITVNALRLKLHLTGEEVILSSAQSDIEGCPGCPPAPACHDFVTGGGWIEAGGGRANFGFNAGFKAGSAAPEVHFNYVDHDAGLHVKALTIGGYGKGSTQTSRTFTGEAEVNGRSGYTYQVEVADNGEPGRRTDTMKIWLSFNNDNYSNGGALGGGNIQLHRPCP